MIRVFNAYGLPSFEIITNAQPLQKVWCRENNLPANLPSEKIVLHQIMQLHPEIIWMDDLHLATDAFIRQVKKNVPGLKLLVVHHCAPFHHGILSRLQLFDIVFTCVPHLHAAFRNHGLNAKLVYHGFDPANLLIAEDTEKKYSPVVFSGSLYTGTAFHQQRIYYLEKMIREGIDIKIFANTESRWKFIARKGIEIFRHGISHVKGTRYYNRLLRQHILPPVFGQEMYSLLGSSQLCFNIHGEVAGPSAGNMRLFEATGMGTCLITDWKENLAELFEPEKEVVTYQSVEECIDKIKWLLNNPSVRNKIAKAGQMRTLKEHTIENRVQQLNEIIKNELRTIKG
jgi:glycosyltransferase involved in cell wall biosynthesis